MSLKTKRIILAVAIVQIILILSLLALPKIALAIPGRYRVALTERSPFLGELTEEIIGRVVPMSAVLPAPEQNVSQPAITIPAIKPTELPVSTPTPTTQVQESPLRLTIEAGESIVTVTEEPPHTPTPSPSPTATLEPLPTQVRIEGMKRVKQGFNNCGPANLTQVLNWYGNATTQAEAASYLKPNVEDRNVSSWQLSDYVNDFTELRSTVHSGGDLELIKQFVAEGFPVVVEKGYELESVGWFGHYLTVFGYDDDKQTFNAMDSFLKVDEIVGRIVSYEEMDQYWWNFNNTFYVVYEPEDEELVYRILGEEMLEPLKMWENAAIMAQNEIEVDPNNAFSWFNLGTSLTRMGELTGEAGFYQNGAAAFDRARQIGLPPRMLWYEFRLYIAYMKVGRYDDMLTIANAILSDQGGMNVEETYLYKGHALLYKGDVRGAASAYERAILLNENFYPAEIALDSLG